MELTLVTVVETHLPLLLRLSMSVEAGRWRQADGGG